MLILIFGIALIITIVCLIGACKTIDSDVTEFLIGAAVVSGIVMVIDLAVFILMVPGVATSGKIDEKIAMYEEENAKIEAQMDILVEKYMKYEQETFSDLKTEESAITLVTLFPELKSDELVQTQINVYTSNNTQIKNLKEEKINMQTKRWILFF